MRQYFCTALDDCRTWSCWKFHKTWFAGHSNSGSTLLTAGIAVRSRGSTYKLSLLKSYRFTIAFSERLVRSHTLTYKSFLQIFKLERYLQSTSYSKLLAPTPSFIFIVHLRYTIHKKNVSNGFGNDISLLAVHTITEIYIFLKQVQEIVLSEASRCRYIGTAL